MKKNFLLLALFSLIFANDPAFAKRKQKQIKIREIAIPYEYILQSQLSQSECEKMVDIECFRRDHMRDQPYYHQSGIVLFHDKIFATQFFENREKSKNMLLLKVNDGSYKLTTDNGNLISFNIKNGTVSDLQLIRGDLTKEKKLESKCDLAEAVYGFYQAYDKSGIIEKSVLFRDKYDFSGLKEIIFFVEKSKQEEVLALLRNNLRNLDAIKNLRICKIANEENYFLRHFSADECEKNRDDATAAECDKYSACEDFLVIKNCEVVLLKDAMN
ncbi:MAG: hypothetical protein A2887_01480 [Alphaproteobacteria bacterium RIFCSPLOWO2_01_FULL_40_26]|nr:MAG: hypothetical protein A3D15_04180 [Alphaproteobacteria bacterium RIFCSPHIGHO2_02_FULL_40_34]OFW88308.1 MAG: hypothetical protein A2794_04830 [Alphaproteobacteria bacterium RIFCSPHIGHO2_01_FULL_40_8]OFW94955.1 MAG: hypothetical protein A2887_01480 [Alphaproteobacteria bacterium RIFCSPLOWO2_01_FULL_40_26]OFX09898.1 MAG: hypothetical protein A3H30_06110 [Alphaproteobacteria bacterium RIFCSPLOWO2_02_FULL_40_19]OFX10781.1 MAG: hypothetical protein A3G22_01660 [Alphaproteobacteria bacterium RI